MNTFALHYLNNFPKYDAFLITAQLLGFDDYIPPFANARGEEILKGVNYASGAAGIRSESGQEQVTRSNIYIYIYIYIIQYKMDVALTLHQSLLAFTLFPIIIYFYNACVML